LLLSMEPAELPGLSEEDRERWRIYLVGILPLGDNHYRLDFVEGGTSANIVLEYVPRMGILISHEFDQFFRGRATAYAALKALGSLVRGEAVDFPIEIQQDGGDRPC
jgi:hypothetical protein